MSLPFVPVSVDSDEVGGGKKRADPRALGVKCERGSILSPPGIWADEADLLKKRVVGAISAGIQRAAKLGDCAAFLVESGAVLLWNYHIHIFRAQAYSSIMTELVDALQVSE